MKIIILTSFVDDMPIYVNIEQIGHFYKEKLGKVGTRVCVTTHNNGGLKVNESPELIMRLINRAEGRIPE
jgi:hypothetical protein